MYWHGGLRLAGPGLRASSRWMQGSVLRGAAGLAVMEGSPSRSGVSRSCPTVELRIPICATALPRGVLRLRGGNCGRAGIRDPVMIEAPGCAGPGLAGAGGKFLLVAKPPYYLDLAARSTSSLSHRRPLLFRLVFHWALALALSF